MFFLLETHYGTIVSTFSSICWPEMEIKMCKFGMFRINPHAPPRTGVFQKIIFVVEIYFFIRKKNFNGEFCIDRL